jgi:nicotinamidase-related amidase
MAQEASMSDRYITPHAGQSVLITIDTQNDFTIAGAPARIAGTSEVVPAMARTLQAFRAAGRPIVHVIRLYAEDGSNVEACRRRLIEGGASIARPGTDGAELVANLKPTAEVRLDAEKLLAGELQQIGENEWVLYKPRWSAFHQTRLEEHLRRLDIDTVVMTGCNFPNCPRSTIHDASNRDLRLVVVTDAMSGLYDKGLQELTGIGVALMRSDDIKPWLEKPA